MTFAGFRLPPLYPITDTKLAGGATHVQLAEALVRAGATWIQIRDKHLNDRELRDQVRACAGIPGAKILVNDRPDIALVTGAAGVHLGDKDIPVEDARALLGPGAIIGISTHSVSEAVQASSRPADYVALGPVFPTNQATELRDSLGLEAIREAASRLSKPLVAIGGINLERADAVLQAGAASVAVISDLMTSTDLESRTMAYLKLASSGRRIYIVGFMGAGKSLVGAALARNLGCAFVDLDEAIEYAAKIPTAQYGSVEIRPIMTFD